MSFNEYFRALAVEHPPVKDVAQVIVGGALIPSPYWVTLLQDVNLILAFFVGLCSAIVSGAAVYRLWKRSRSR